MEAITEKKVIACKLTNSEFKKRKEQVIATLKNKILDRQELQDGYRYKFEGSDKIVDEVVDFVKTERLCCDFFAFNLSFIGNNLWLTISGPEAQGILLKLKLIFNGVN